MNIALLWLPETSVAVYVTMDRPGAKKSPDCWFEVSEEIPQSSVATGGFHVMTAPHWPGSVTTEIGSGKLLMTGLKGSAPVWQSSGIESRLQSNENP